jgi:hypothetical protein
MDSAIIVEILVVEEVRSQETGFRREKKDAAPCYFSMTEPKASH